MSHDCSPLTYDGSIPPWSSMAFTENVRSGAALFVASSEPRLGVSASVGRCDAFLVGAITELKFRSVNATSTPTSFSSLSSDYQRARLIRKYCESISVSLRPVTININEGLSQPRRDCSGLRVPGLWPRFYHHNHSVSSHPIACLYTSASQNLSYF